MTADVTRDRRVTVPILGFTNTAFVDGSRLFWALPSLVHEGLGHRAIEPDRIQGDAVLPHAGITAQSRDHVLPLSLPPIVPTRNRAPGLPPSRRGLAKVEPAALVQRRPALTAAARGAPGRIEVGTKKRPPGEQRN
jgi:hypothetical protein